MSIFQGKFITSKKCDNILNYIEQMMKLFEYFESPSKKTRWRLEEHLNCQMGKKKNFYECFELEFPQLNLDGKKSTADVMQWNGVGGICEQTKMIYFYRLAF